MKESPVVDLVLLALSAEVLPVAELLLSPALLLTAEPERALFTTFLSTWPALLLADLCAEDIPEEDLLLFAELTVPPLLEDLEVLPELIAPDDLEELFPDLIPPDVLSFDLLERTTPDDLEPLLVELRVPEDLELLLDERTAPDEPDLLVPDLTAADPAFADDDLPELDLTADDLLLLLLLRLTADLEEELLALVAFDLVWLLPVLFTCFDLPCDDDRLET